MKVKNLIELLKKQDSEAEVLTYIDQTEMYGKTERVILYTDVDKMPYSKTDKPQIKDNIVLIEGWDA